MIGTHTIIKEKAIPLTTLKIPITTYSWNKADTVNVVSMQKLEEKPTLRVGK